jgi:hypothetical protein
MEILLHLLTAVLVALVLVEEVQLMVEVLVVLAHRAKVTPVEIHLAAQQHLKMRVVRVVVALVLLVVALQL